MDDMVRKAIEQIVDSNMRSFATGLKGRHLSEIDNPNGVINSKRKNVFIKELGSEFSVERCTIFGGSFNHYI